MSIDSYVGVPHPCVNVETSQELYEALDLLHTQVMDNLEGHFAYGELLKLLSDAMDKLQDIDVNIMP